MPSSFIAQRERLQRYIRGLRTPDLSEKQKELRHARLKEYAEQFFRAVPLKIEQIYTKKDIREIRHIVSMLTGEASIIDHSQLHSIEKLANARLQAYQNMEKLIQKLRSLEYRLGAGQDVIDTVQDTVPVIETYHTTLHEVNMNTCHNPGKGTSYIIRCAMSDPIKQELHRLYTAGRLDRREVLTALFHAYFLYLESQGKHTSLTDVKRLITEILHDEGKTATVNTLFVEKEIALHDGTVRSEQGIIAAVTVNIFEQGTGTITAYVDADASMNHAVRDALTAAMSYLKTIVDPELIFDMFDYSWSIEHTPTSDLDTPFDQPVRYAQESIGLSIAVAAIAAASTARLNVIADNRRARRRQ